VLQESLFIDKAPIVTGHASVYLCHDVGKLGLFVSVGVQSLGDFVPGTRGVGGSDRIGMSVLNNVPPNPAPSPLQYFDLTQIGV
jgi:hypothetical protein